MEGHLQHTESQHQEKFTLAQENTKVVQHRRQELDSINGQVCELPEPHPHYPAFPTPSVLIPVYMYSTTLMSSSQYTCIPQPLLVLIPVYMHSPILDPDPSIYTFPKLQFLPQYINILQP